jgi:mevalonate kinase
MTTQLQMRRELERCYGFLKAKANSRGLIAITQEKLASELGVGLPKFNRLVHRLKNMGVLKISGGGRQPKMIYLTPVDADGVLIIEDVSPDPSDERTTVALRLFDAICEAIATTKT